MSASDPCVKGARPKGPGYCAGERGGYEHREVLEDKLSRALVKGELATHSCDNRWCVNPDHIHLGSKSSNMKEAVERHPTLKSNLRKTEEQKKVLSQKTREYFNLLSNEEKEKFREATRKANSLCWGTRTTEQRELHREACRRAAIERSLRNKVEKEQRVRELLSALRDSLHT